MSRLADSQRTSRQLWALPGGSHDRTVRVLKIALPAGVGVLAAFLVSAPFTMRGEVSFLLDKKDVDVAGERLKVREALYRGQDGKGRPFSIRAGSAVQKSSREPVVEMKDLSARILMQRWPGGADGQHRALFYGDREGRRYRPVQFSGAGGYRLTTSDVDIDIRKRTMGSQGPVFGRMPLGAFTPIISMPIWKRKP
jgi:lipopolysaccharide export system protein LptC